MTTPALCLPNMSSPRWAFYPNTCQDVYLLASPTFTRITVKLGDSGKILIISAPDLSPENKYVQSATLNRKPWEQAWFSHAAVGEPRSGPPSKTIFRAEPSY